MHSNTRRALVAGISALGLITLATLVTPTAVAGIRQLELDASAQSFEVSTLAARATVAPDRDAFAITEFTVVQWPLDSATPISSFFGYRSCAGCSTLHSGIDFTPGAGHPIEAIADGVVVEADPTGSWGVHVILEHDVDGVTYRSAYAHLQTGSMTLAVGDPVTRGQVIGRVGDTGQSEGAHLHFVVEAADGTFLDPLDWLRQHVTQVWGE